MTHTYVALDLETTGLNPSTCEIIEVGAVKFTLDGVIGTFQTMVKPFGSLPYYIQRLTGIRPQEVEQAPPLAVIAGDLEEFVGTHPVIGHNIAFDLSFLAAAGIQPSGAPIDTHDLSTILAPRLAEHSLRGLAATLGIDFPVRHRALADAQATRQVFLALRSRLAEKPGRLLAELLHIAKVADWPLRTLLVELVDETPPLYGEPEKAVRAVIPPALVARDAVEPLDTAEIESVFSRPEAVPGLFPDFEKRAEQVEMAHAVAEALNDSGQLVVEAGTGTGKSLAYLVPAAAYALRNSARVVVSTDTINLQEQLMGKDIPLLKRLLGLEEEGGPDGREDERLRAAQLKGRRNYLCLLRFGGLRGSDTLTVDEARLLARVLLWLPETQTGDRAELNLSPQQEVLWRRISADNETCLTLPCQYVRNGACFLHRARKRAEASHVLIVNHALLLSDVATDGHVLPEYRHLIIDEAHNLEEEATQQFGFQAGEADIIDLLDRIHVRRGRSSGLVASLNGAARALPEPEQSALRHLAGELGTAADNARRSLPLLFDLLASFLSEQALEQGEYDRRLLLSRAMRIQPDWAPVEVAWENVDAAFHGILERLKLAIEALSDVSAERLPAYEELMADLTNLLQETSRLREGVAGVVGSYDESRIAWMTGERLGAGVTLASAPLEVATPLQSGLFAKKDAVVLTGATLSVRGSTGYLCDRVGLEEPRELVLGSPFDYEHSTLLLLPRDLPEPAAPSYQPAVEQVLTDLCRASEGRALVLFTSHGALRTSYAAVHEPLQREDILVLGQGIDGSPKQLLNRLREEGKTVILGTSSFWEGVDVIGEALSMLVIARLPFAVPTDPVLAARSELFDDPFNEYMLPQAVIRFKQGFGRLIRRKTDRGVVVVLDRRIRSKGYGSAFLQSLPPCTVRELAMREAPGAVKEWLGRNDG